MLRAALAAPCAALACSDAGDVLGDAAAADAAIACPGAGPWAAAPPVRLGATQETAAVALDGRIYVLGGFHIDLGVVPAVQIYDTATCTWSPGPDLPRPVHHVNAAVVDGTIYVVGALADVSFEATGAVWAWTPSDPGGGWIERAPMPPGTERGAAVAGAVSGTIVVAGGFRGGAAVADVSQYNSEADEWTRLLDLPRPRDHACGGFVAGTLYVVGGREGTIDSRAGTVYEQGPKGEWITRTPMPTPRGGAGCAVVGDRLIVVGGEGNPATATRVFAEAEAYVAGDDAWETLAPMPTPRHGMGAAAWDGRLYVPGGATHAGFAAVATHEVLTP